MSDTLKPPEEEVPLYVWTVVQQDERGLTDAMRVPGGWLYRSVLHSRGGLAPLSFEFFVPQSEVDADSRAGSV
jgi:hypothetical protein